MEAMSWERIVFDVGKDEVKLRQMLQESLDLFGNDATLLLLGPLIYNHRNLNAFGLVLQTEMVKCHVLGSSCLHFAKQFCCPLC